MADGGAKNKVFKKASFEEAATEGSFFAFKFFSLFLENQFFLFLAKKGFTWLVWMSLEDIGIGFGPQEISFHILFKLEKKKKKKFKERTWINIS